jgi:hypothetical protein
MSRLPPWTGDDAAMLRWLDHKLDDLIKEDGAKARARRALPLSSKEKQALFPEDSDEGAIAAAEERGDIGPLQRRHPKLARFLQLPARQRGQRYPRDMQQPHDERLALAVLEVSRIRAIWQKYFEQKNRSPRRGEKSAEWFAAERWDCTEDEIIKAMKMTRLRLPK